ncbi:MAG: hypothetical protein AMXMBFR46_21350 [Acidimicrobiia bacterium]
MTDTRSYRFADAQRPGMLIGLSGRQAVPLVSGVLFLALVLQTPLPAIVGVLGPALGCTVAFGRWRGTPLAETLVPGARLLIGRRGRRRRWVMPLLADNTHAPLPQVLAGMELVDDPHTGFGVVRDRTAGTLSAVVRVHGHGFALASGREQDAILAAWGGALSPFAREQSPVAQVVWQEWAHPVTADTHQEFLAAIGLDRRAEQPAVADYRALVDEQAPVTIAHETLVTVTVDQRRVRTRRRVGSRLAAAVETLRDEVRLFTTRLDTAGIAVEAPLSALELSTAVRLRSDPARAARVIGLGRSLAAATRRGALEWGPMLVEPQWGHVHVDAAYHRAYRVAGWPPLPVGADWLGGILIDTPCVRTVTVVLEPVPMGRAARAADREVMAREADAALKTEKGFRVTAREKKRLADVENRERELSEGHAEFRFAGIVTVTASDLDTLDDHCADVEQAAGQCLVDLRPLEARHEAGWVASLPLGRIVARGTGP